MKFSCRNRETRTSASSRNPIYEIQRQHRAIKHDHTMHHYIIHARPIHLDNVYQTLPINKMYKGSSGKSFNNSHTFLLTFLLLLFLKFQLPWMLKVLLSEKTLTRFFFRSICQRGAITVTNPSPRRSLVENRSHHLLGLTNFSLIPEFSSNT